MLRRLREWLQIGSLDRAPHATEEGQPVENLDAMAAAVSQHGSDPSGRALHAVTMIDANGAGGDQRLRKALLDLLKDDKDSSVGPMTLKEFVMLHMLASLNNEGDSRPPSSGRPTRAIWASPTT